MSGERGNQNERTVGLQFVNQMTTSISSNCRKIRTLKIPSALIYEFNKILLMTTLTGNSELLPSDIIDFTMLLALRQSNQWYIAHATEANP